MAKKLLQPRRISQNIFLFEGKSEICYFNRLDFSREYYNGNGPVVYKKLDNENLPIFSEPDLKKVRVEVTFRCNCRCRYCLVYQNDISRKIGHMSRATALKIVKYYKKNVKKGSLMIIGGEPLLNWPVVKLLIEKIKDPIKVFTNGTIINKAITDTLKKNRHVRLMVSLDGKEADNEDRIGANGKPIYRLVKKNLRKYLKKGCKLGIGCLINKRTVKKIPELVKYLHKGGVDVIGLSFPHFVKSEKVNKKIDIDMLEYAGGLIKTFDYIVANKIYFDQISKRISPFFTKKFRYYSCKGIGEEVTFYPDGRMTNCTKIDTLPDRKNFDKAYLKKILPINNNLCRDCPALGICGGGCPWDGIMRYKYGIDQRECILNKKLLEFFIWKIRELEKKKRKIDFLLK